MSRTRKPVYRNSRRFDRTCRCNGSCAYCRSNRLHAVRVQEQAAEDEFYAAFVYDDDEALAEADERKWRGRG